MKLELIIKNFALRLALKERLRGTRKWPIVPGIIDSPKFNYEDLEEILAGGQGSFGVIGNASRYVHTYYAYA